MKPDMTANNNREKRQVGIIADHNSQPEKVLFFSDTHFFFFKSLPTLHTLASPTCRHTNQSLSKSATLLTLQIVHQ